MAASNAEHAPIGLVARIWRTVCKEPVLAILVLALVVLQAMHPRAWTSLPGLVDWQTVLTLAGLLILTKAIELSGFLIVGRALARASHSW